MKRTGLRRSRRRTITRPDELMKGAFAQEAATQRACAIPGCRERDHQAHHVLYEQHLRREGLPRWDPRNCLRLCNRHHELHHKAAERIPRSALRSENVDYVHEALGRGRGEGYLARYYGPA